MTDMYKSQKLLNCFISLLLAVNSPLTDAQHGGTILTAEDVHDIEVQIEKLGVALGIPGMTVGIARQERQVRVQAAPEGIRERRQRVR